MAHFTAPNIGGGPRNHIGGGGFRNQVPVVIPSQFRDPKFEPDSEQENERKKANRIVGDARVVNRAFSRLRISQACNAYLGVIGLGI